MPQWVLNQVKVWLFTLVVSKSEKGNSEFYQINDTIFKRGFDDALGGS